MRTGQRAAPSIGFGARISVEADNLKRKLQLKLGVSASKLIERALAALERELNQAGQPAE
jgi:hypothetical protein